MRTSAENAIGSQATSAGVPHTDRTRGGRSSSPAEAAGVTLERRPSRLLSLHAGHRVLCRALRLERAGARAGDHALAQMRTEPRGALGKAQLAPQLQLVVGVRVE